MNEIKLDKSSFSKFNSNDHLGLFNDQIQKISRGIAKIDESATSLFDYDEYVKKLQINLFIKYSYLILTEDDSLYGVIENNRTLIKSKLKGWYKQALNQKRGII